MLAEAMVLLKCLCVEVLRHGFDIACLKSEIFQEPRSPVHLKSIICAGYWGSIYKL